MKNLIVVATVGLLLLPIPAIAHAPSVSDQQGASPDTAVMLPDPTLSRAIGATIDRPGEIDWYRMDLVAGDPLVVGMTAPDAVGSLPATFVLLGPGLPDAASAGEAVASLADAAGVAGAVVFQPAAEPKREVHAGLGFLNYGTLRLDAPESGTYWVAVSAVDPTATGKYVLAPGVREEFGVDAIDGMADLIGFFVAPWPPLSEVGSPAPGASASPG